MGMVKYMGKETVIEKIERIAFENGLFITNFDFSFPEYFEKLFQDVSEFLDRLSVTLFVPAFIPSREKFIHICLENTPDELSEDFFRTGILKKENYYEAKPKLYISLDFDFTDNYEKKRYVFPILKKYEKKFGALDVRHCVYENLSDYLEVVFEITDFSIDYFYMDLL